MTEPRTWDDCYEGTQLRPVPSGGRPTPREALCEDSTAHMPHTWGKALFGEPAMCQGVLSDFEQAAVDRLVTVYGEPLGSRRPPEQEQRP